MATTAKLQAVLQLDSSPFFRGLNKAMAFSKAAARQFARQPFRTTAIVAGLGGAGAIRGIASGIVGAAKIGVQALKYLSIAGGGVAAIFAAGAIEAIHLGGTLDDLSNRTGQTVANVLILRKAFDLAGIGADEVGVLTNRLQRALSGVNEKGESTANTFRMLGLDIGKLRQMDAVGQFQAIGDAINKMPNAADRAAVAIQIFGRAGGQVLQLFRDPNTFRQATESLGKQTGILQKNAVLFGQIEDKASRIKDRVQGFFVALDSAIAGRLFNVLDKLGSYDLANVGKSFGEGVGKGIDALAGAFSNPKELGDFIAEGFTYGLKMGGNVLIGVFQAGIEFLKDGLISLWGGIGQVIISALIDAFKSPIAYLQAGIESAMHYFDDDNIQHMERAQKNAQHTYEQAKANNAGHKLDDDYTTNGSASSQDVADAKAVVDANRRAISDAREKQTTEQQEDFDARYNRHIKEASAPGNASQFYAEQGAANIEEGIEKAVEKVRGFKVGNALNADPSQMKLHFQNLANSGSGFTQTPSKNATSAKFINPETGKPYGNDVVMSYLKQNAYSRDAMREVYGEQGGLQYDKQHSMGPQDEARLRGQFGNALVNAKIKSGADPRELLGAASGFQGGVPVNGTGGMSLSYKGSGQGPLINMLGQTGALSGYDSTLSGGRGFAPGVGSALDQPATSTIARNPDGSPQFDGNAFLAATGTIHGYSSMNRMNADFKKAGLNKDNPTLAAQKAAAHNSYLTAKALGEQGTDVN